MRRRRQALVDRRTQYEIDVEEGTYYYLSLPPANGGGFPVMQEILFNLGVEADFSNEPSGGRGFRILRETAHLLPSEAVNKYNTIPYGCPIGNRHGGTWPLNYCDGLEVLHSEWVRITDLTKSTERGDTPEDKPPPVSSKRRRRRKM